jgi:FlaA1/EpsC-like NDP-sugar epimerase
MVNNNVTEESEIAKFYDGRSVFITGATGFMGKVCVSLSDSCKLEKNSESVYQTFN